MKDPKTNKYVLVVIQIILMTIGSTCSQRLDKHNTSIIHIAYYINFV